MRRLGSHAPRGLGAEIKTWNARRVLLAREGSLSEPGEADQKLLQAWARGQEGDILSPLWAAVLCRAIGRAKSLRESIHIYSALTCSIKHTSSCSSANSSSQNRLSNSHELSEHQGSHPALCPPERSQISAINPPPPPNASQYMADNSLADILILAVLCLAGIGSAAYVVLRRLQRVEERALGDVELQDLKRDEDLTFEGQVVKGDVFLPQGL